MSTTSTNKPSGKSPPSGRSRRKRTDRSWLGGKRPTAWLIVLSAYLAIFPILLMVILFWLWPAFEMAQSATATSVDASAPAGSPSPSAAPVTPAPSSAPQASQSALTRNPISQATATLFGRVITVSFSTGSSLLALSVLCGALGTCVYLIQSFITFVGNRTFGQSWGLWYLMRPAQGAALAAALYFILRAGLQGAPGFSAPANLYGVAAISVLAGMFVSNAIDKLADIFNVVFASSSKTGDEERADKANDVPPVELATTEPGALTAGVGHTAVKVLGIGFDTSTVVCVDGQERTTVFVSPTTLEVILTAEDTSSPAMRELTAVSSGGEVSNHIDLPIT